MASGDDIEAGKITGAESTTFLNGQSPSEGNVGFNGDEIFHVGPQLGGPTQPINPKLDAIRGVGFGSAGTGVIGQGSGTGVGVRGVGASSPGGSPSSPNPSSGLLGEGGRQNDVTNTARAPHGAGVVGVAGAQPVPGQSPRAIPPFTDTGNVGVFGLGGDAETRGSATGGGLSGPNTAGPGVLGQGGVSRNFLATPPVDDLMRDGVGVAGASGSSTLPQHSEMVGCGVYGTGIQFGVAGDSFEGIGVNGNSREGTGVNGVTDSKGTGVKGFSSEGTGVHGVSGSEGFGVHGVSSEGSGVYGWSTAGTGVTGGTLQREGRGGIFFSGFSAQVQLAPLEVATGTQTEAFTPQAFSVLEKREVRPAKLPKDGEAGDLLVTTPSRTQRGARSTLWFCAKGQDDSGPAKWREVLMGKEFDGTE